MTARDYLWCVLNLLLDDEAEIALLCPSCRAMAEEERCPVCGRPSGQWSGGENACFDRDRFEKLRRGEPV